MAASELTVTVGVRWTWGTWLFLTLMKDWPARMAWGVGGFALAVGLRAMGVL